MKRVKVEREMPFAKVGEYFEITPNSLNNIGCTTYSWDSFMRLIEGNWLSWVEEEKSLEEEFLGHCFFQGFDDSCIKRHVKFDIGAKGLAKIAEAYYKKRFDEAIVEYDKTHGQENRVSQRVAVRAALFGKGDKSE